MKYLNKFIRIIFTLVILSVTSSQTKAQIVSQFTYGDSLIEEAYSIFETQDSLLIITGYTQSKSDSTVAYDDNVYVIKTDIDGNHIWSNGYKIGVNERGYSIIENLHDSSYEYIVVGDVTIKSSAKKTTDAFLLRLDSNGNIININRYGSSRNEHARSVIAVDSGYVFVGYSNHFQNTKYDVYLVRTDWNGNQIWAQNIDISLQHDFGFDILQKDSSFYITGYSVDTLTKKSQVFLISTALNGNVNWVKLYGDSIENDFSYSLKETLDDGFIMIGDSYDQDSTSNSHAYIIQTDGSGVAQWYGKYDFGTPDSSDFGRDILVDQDSSYFCVGTSWVDSSNGLNKTIFKLDFAGNLTWVKSFGGPRQDFGYAGALLPNNVIGVGTTYSLGVNLPNAYLSKTTKTDSVDCVDFIPEDSLVIYYQSEKVPNYLSRNREDWASDSSFSYRIDKFDRICLDSADRYGFFNEDNFELVNSGISLYPNPSTGDFYIYNKSDDNINSIKIYDIAGKEVAYTSNLISKSQIQIKIIDRQFNSGVYHCQILHGNSITSIRVILMKY